MKPTEMVPVFRLSWPDPVVHRHTLLKTKTKDTYDDQIELSRVTDCGQSRIDYVVRTRPEPGKRFGKVTWRSEIGSWMQFRHAFSMRAHLCRRCWPADVAVNCRCDRCRAERVAMDQETLAGMQRVDERTAANERALRRRGSRPL